MSTSTAGSETGVPPLPAPGTAPVYPRPPKSVGLALILSLFPGLGQVYNGQPAKALLFFSAWVASIYFTVEAAPLPFAFLIPFVYFYNLVDAFRTATAINDRAAGGVPAAEEETIESPAWGLGLIALGLVLLMNNLGWLHLAALQRFWPVVLIVLGAVFLYGSVQRQKGTDAGNGPTY
jgi:TM2 domain-containing membrane protein YozV